jgi:hypothetical protein
LNAFLKPGGIAVIEVPAGPDLYDIYDQELLHFRRYHMAALQKMLRSAGLEILDKSHLGYFLYPAFHVVKKRNRKQMSLSPEERSVLVKRDMGRSSSSKFLHGIMRVEAHFGRFVSYPTGIRCLVTCRRVL